ncbi:hypothetical protein BDFB_003188 [Asbolus verrucosus]|uniref:Uncharacterized protein n=1 Tax=Asbolus verrucosus TaxID=1661398 RepID=A0A482VW87_ASBVE|nr:hypothetical protein BDFB_003188 [Asbolus verrucosus]
MLLYWLRKTLKTPSSGAAYTICP